MGFCLGSIGITQLLLGCEQSEVHLSCQESSAADSVLLYALRLRQAYAA